MEEASLSDYVDAGADAATDEQGDDGEQADDGEQTGDGAEAASGDERSVARDPSTVDPATTTYAWSADGDSCEACGEETERRWHDGDRLVCPDCKQW